MGPPRGDAARYDVVALGSKFRIDELRAALATARLARLDGETARRRELTRTTASGCPPVSPPPRPRPHHIFTVVLTRTSIVAPSARR